MIIFTHDEVYQLNEADIATGQNPDSLGVWRHKPYIIYKHTDRDNVTQNNRNRANKTLPLSYRTTSTSSNTRNANKNQRPTDKTNDHSPLPAIVSHASTLPTVVASTPSFTYNQQPTTETHHYNIPRIQTGQNRLITKQQPPPRSIPKRNDGY